jgi:putative ATP-binding cassette transporter
MNGEAPPTNKLAFQPLIWKRLWRMLRTFQRSEAGRAAKWLLLGLTVLLFAINGLNVVNSYVGRDFMTAIESRELGRFWWMAAVYAGVFLASTTVAVFYRFAEERLGLCWRNWLTGHAVRHYMEHRTYYWMKDAGELENPDQRIADDVRALTVTTLSFLLMILNGTFTVIAFAGVMWSISPLLFGVAVLYAAVGSLFTILLGKPLVWLNYKQLDREANFRAELVHVRENAESVALLHREARMQNRIQRRLDDLVDNMRRIIAVNRNLGFFTTGYNYMIQIIPALLVAPMFIRGQVEFGVITQSAMAFTHLVGAFSLIITQFQSISTYAAVVARLSALSDSIERARGPESFAVKLHREAEKLGFEQLTLRSPEDGRVLVDRLDLTIPHGLQVLVTGPDEKAKVALFRAAAGLWHCGEGAVVRPDLETVLFLPERPYLPPGTLRDLLVRAGREGRVTDAEVERVVEQLGLRPVLARAGGLDAEQDWDNILSLAEQQLLAAARVLLARPPFAMLEHIDTALGGDSAHRVVELLRGAGISCIVLDGDREHPRDYDAVLELEADGTWTWRQLQVLRTAVA